MIRAHADVGLLDLDLVAKQTRETGHSTMGLITALRAALPEEAREWVYYGATVQDLSDTWFALVSRAVGDIAERDVTRMRDRVLELAVRYRDTPMCGGPTGSPGSRSRSGSRPRSGPPKWTATCSGCARAGPGGGGAARRGAGDDGVLGDRAWACWRGLPAS